VKGTRLRPQASTPTRLAVATPITTLLRRGPRTRAFLLARRTTQGDRKTVPASSSAKSGVAIGGGSLLIAA